MGLGQLGVAQSANASIPDPCNEPHKWLCVYACFTWGLSRVCTRKDPGIRSSSYEQVEVILIALVAQSLERKPLAFGRALVSVWAIFLSERIGRSAPR